MIRFFVDSVNASDCVLTGEEAHHAIKSLRVRENETVTLCDNTGFEYICSVISLKNEEVHLSVLEKKPCIAEPSVKITLFQSVPKGDKMDFIVQKAAELGVFEIVPTLSARCVSRPDEKTLCKKAARWQKIAKEAAKQSQRGLIPKILPAKNLDMAAKCIPNYDVSMVCYEGGGERMDEILPNRANTVSLYIGPEGGYEETEVELLRKSGAQPVTLGKRILRTETAPIAAMSILTYLLER